VRDSPALTIAEELQSQRAAVVVYDPRAIPDVIKLSPTLDAARTVEDACTGADVVMVLTDWQQFRDLDPTVIASMTRQRILVDGRHAMPADLWIKSGWTYLT
jgi:UDPglucose 6-dehydrogenase